MNFFFFFGAPNLGCETHLVKAYNKKDVHATCAKHGPFYIVFTLKIVDHEVAPK